VIKALVSIEVDLAASRTMRFACQLGNFMPVELHPVYIKESPPRELSIGSGWARRHWEQELIKEGKKEISEWIASEIDYSPEVEVMEPRVVYGDRDAEVLRIMEKEPFDLYVEGARFPWNQATLYQKIHSRLFQRAHLPIALAPVLRRIHKLLVPCLDAAGTKAMGEILPKLWSGCSIPVTLALLKGQEGILQPEANRVRQALEEAACQVGQEEVFPFFPSPPSDEYLREYGLVALALESDIKKESPYFEWLSQVKVPLLLVLY
jgi:hypothetical protein